MNILKNIGSTGLDIFWLPVGIWTIVAVLVVGCLKIFENSVPPTYHYHSRVALLWGLLSGVLGSILFHFFPVYSVSEAAISTKFIIVQNPITVTVSAASASVNWHDPTIWIGICTIFTLMLGIGALIKLATDFSSLRSFSKKLLLLPVDLSMEISNKNRKLLSDYNEKIHLKFSNEVSVPCTFGWFNKYIVLPKYLRNDLEKLNMALFHELTHINNNDFLIHTTVKIIKALFFFHPLVHKIAGNIEEYREITCDRHVLQNTDISHKSYASLLLQLSQKPVFKTSAVINMAINPSNLKKRIQTMKNSTQFIPSMKWSMSFMLVFTLMITGLMSCSDIEENGITRSEIEDTQQSMSENSANTPPLYIVNGEIVETIKPEGAFFRIKPKYIESIEVLNPEKGIEIYGDAAKNGVLKLELNDMRAALDDLQDKSKKNEVENNTTVPRKSIFVAVEQNPTMIGGAEALYNNLEYPEQCQQAQIEGRVIVSFVVTKQGNVADPEILRGIGGGCDEAALKAVSDLSFKPARQRGKAVNVQYSQPVMFSLSDDGNINKSAEQGAVQGSAMEVRNLQLTADGTLSGEVYSTKENAPLKAANVYISSLERGAATDENGKFRIDNVEKNSGTLRVTFVGYSTTEVNFN